MRADAYPEGVKYPDTGCEVAPSCLSCPLEVCVHDEGRWKGWERRDAQMRELSAAGVTNDELAAAAGLGPRSIFRVLAQRREWK
jgi:hypothetical protein